MSVKTGEEKQQYDVINGEGEMLMVRAEDARRRSEGELRLKSLESQSGVRLSL